MQPLQANLQSRAATGNSVLETVAAMCAVLYKATSRLGYELSQPVPWLQKSHCF